MSDNNKIDLVKSYLESWGNQPYEVDYYLSLKDWEEYFSFLWEDKDLT